MKKRFLIVVCMLGMMSMLFAANAFAAANFWANRTSDTSFEIWGYDVKDAAGIELYVTYDTVAFSLPKVTWGSLATGTKLYNANLPGAVLITSMNTATLMKGTGPVATITFSPKVNPANGTVKVTPTVRDKSGNVLPSTSVDPTLQ